MTGWIDVEPERAVYGSVQREKHLTDRAVQELDREAPARRRDYWDTTLVCRKGEISSGSADWWLRRGGLTDYPSERLLYKSVYCGVL